ncbi:MAG: hypothetical protein KDB22_22185 [Planctomycetales bacterium]|nr:hypothetical protein [Planctomycetales bacterium]
MLNIAILLLAGWAQDLQSGGGNSTPPASQSATTIAKAANVWASAHTRVAVASASPISLRSADATFRGELQAILREAAESLDEATLPAPDLAKSRLTNAIEELEIYLVPGSENGQKWLSFLRLDELKSALDAERTDVRLLKELELNMLQNYQGLEYPQFQSVRTALTEMLNASKYGANPTNTIRLFRSRIDELVELLDTESTNADTERGFVRLLTYLDESGQATQQVGRLRNRFSLPNFQVRASEQLVRDLFSRVVAEPGPVNECILGTRVVGSACLSGQVEVDVLSMNDGISLCLILRGCMTSDNTGYNRGVVIKTLGSSPVIASKQIFVTPTNISALPTTASTNLQTTITSFQHRSRIVRRIAKRKAAEQKPQADAIAEHRLQNRIQSGYDDQVQSLLDQANAQLSDMRNPRPAFVRLGVPRPQLMLHSTDSSVNGSVLQAAKFQLAAANPCPLPVAEHAKVVVTAHHSALVNALDLVLSSRTIESSDLDNLAYQFLGRVPEEVAREAESDEWAVTFASYRPIQFELEDDKIKVSVHMSYLAGNAGSITGNSTVTATYTVQVSDDALQVVRQGEVVADFANGGGGARNVGTRAMLRKKFDQVFPETFSLAFAELKQRFPKLAELSVGSLRTQQGWMQLVLQ